MRPSVCLHSERGKSINQWLLCKGLDSPSLYADVFDLFLGKITGQ